VTPADGATGVPVNTPVKAVFAAPIAAGSLSMGLKTAAGATVTGTTTYDAAIRTGTFTPTAALTSLTTYTSTVTATNSSGLAMTAPKTWSFTTTDPAPPTVTSTSPTSGATGVAATTSVTATFSKPITTSTLAMTLKDAAGTAIAGTTTYDATTRVATLNPTANLASFTVYTATATAANAAGVPMAAPKSWSFTTADTDPPSVSSTAPTRGATNVAVSPTITATFARAISTTGYTFTLRAAGASSDVAGSTAYTPGTRTLKFTPTAALTSSTSYTATVSARSAAGVVMPTAYTWTFTTTAVTYSLYTTSQTPSANVSSTAATTVGVRFSPSRAGKVTAIRYFASSANTGNTVKLWTSTGTELGTATATGSGTGWRTATFATSISVSAGTQYVASYYAPVGRYSSDTGSYSFGYTNGPLSVPASGGRTGVGNVFPNTASINNLWVDVLVSI
jgi:hypothetical protein